MRALLLSPVENKCVCVASLPEWSARRHGWLTVNKFRCRGERSTPLQYGNSGRNRFGVFFLEGYYIKIRL